MLNGWFAVKQPNTQELEQRISWKTARENEEAFFATTRPWAGVPLATRKRLGTRKLVDSLSDILAALIMKRCAGAFYHLEAHTSYKAT